MSKRYGVLIVAGLAAWLLLSGKSRAAEPPDVTDYIPPENPDADNWDLLPDDWYMNPQTTMAERNRAAFLAMLRHAEGTDLRPDPYSVLYGYVSHPVDFRDHPAARETYGERRWRGVPLPEHYCRAAGFRAGCVSTAAGAYQFLITPWREAKNALKLPDFSPQSQDRAVLWRLERLGALAHIDAGRIDRAIDAARRNWASLPGAGWGQPERKLESLVDFYADAGGSVA